MRTILEYIYKIYENEEGKRSLWINSCQELIERTDFIGGSEVEALFIELSYNLEFYVEDVILRNEDPSYFGEKKLKKLLFEFLIEYSKIISTLVISDKS